MPRPVCVNCKCEMSCFKTGMYIVNGYNNTYKDEICGSIKCGDGYECNLCGARIGIGFGNPMLIRDHPILLSDCAISLDGSFPAQNIPDKKS